MSVNKQKIKTIRREFFLALTYPFVFILLPLIWLTPRSWRRAFSAFMGKIAYRFSSKGLKTAYNNLTFAYGDTKSEEERWQMARDSYNSITRAMVDFFATGYITNKKKFFSMIEVVGEENLREPYNRGNGVICMVPHLSCWEFSAVTPPMLGYETSAASKPIKGWLYNKIIVWSRQRRGMKNIDRSGSYERLLHVLNKGECLIVMADQDTRVKGAFIEFYGKKAYTPLGISRMALDTQAAVVPMAMVRKEDGSYRFEIYPELTTVRTEDYDADCLENATREAQMYEKIIRKDPTQWVWMHRRWKTTPEKLERFLKQRAKEKKAKMNAKKK